LPTLHDNVGVVTATAGTGTVTLGAAIDDSYYTFAEAGVPNGAEVIALYKDGLDVEYSVGIYSSAGPTLTRATVRSSKIGGTAGTSKINLSGSATVQLVAMAADLLGGADTEIQYNNSGVMDGDPNLAWIAANGLQNKKKETLGSHAAFGVNTVLPGDLVNGYTYGTDGDLNINTFYSGDIASVESVTIGPGVEHTGVGNSFLYGIDVTPGINTNSTGPFAQFYGLYVGPNNYGSGNLDIATGIEGYIWNQGGGDIASMAGMSFQLHHYGAGEVAEARTIRATSPGGAGDILDLAGVYIGDHSGIGSVSSNNIVSKGASSLNVFEGNFRNEGHAAIGNEATIGFIVANPGDPTLEGTFADVSILTLNEYFTGDLSTDPHSGLSIIGGSRHTGVNPASSFGLSLNWAVNTDSTGDFSQLRGLNFNGGNFGSGDVTELIGIEVFADHEGSGTVTNMYGVRSFVEGVAGSITNAHAGYFEVLNDGATYTNVHGVYIPDHSGIGATISNNITSKGASSKNLFEGSVLIDTFIELAEMAAPAAPAANKGRLFMQDNGSGKTQIAVRFPSGAVQVIATEP
jgi:hypothetical protein